jgi:hypothetical protein
MASLSFDRYMDASPLGHAIGYVLHRWDGLTRYCEHGALSIDNNLSERMVRAIAIGRKTYLSLGSDINGAKAAAIVYSVLASAKANQIVPFPYVRDFLQLRLTRCRIYCQPRGARRILTHGVAPDDRRNISGPIGNRV